MRNQYGRIAAQVDSGQRYHVVYVDGTGRTRTYGHTDDAEEADRWKPLILHNRMWKKPRVIDRKPEEKAG